LFPKLEQIKMERNKIGMCHAFQKYGSCKFDAKCKYSHSSFGPDQGRSSSQQLCRHFNTTQGCRFGVVCKFSHSPGAEKEHKTFERNESTACHELDEWKKVITQTQPLGFGLGKFFDQALKLVNLDNASRQDVIRSFATDRGLNKVLELASQHFAGMPENILKQKFTTQLVPFFRAISEENVMSSPLLERHLGNICIYLYGVGGSRGELLFAGVVRALTVMSFEPDIAFFTSLEASLAVLSKIVEFNSTAKVTPKYEVYANTLAAMITPQVDNAADTLRCRAEKHLDGINKRLGIGKTIRDMSTSNDQGSGLAKPVFVLRHDLPGKLSNGRPRHDNDFESIEDIQIMPTSEEIQSTHAEYLPVQDPASWHKMGIQGLLDRHFRLLREDTVGQLRDCARTELEAMRGGGTRAHIRDNSLKRFTYSNAKVEFPKFDPRNGLEFVVSFDQPRDLLPQSEKKREDWWINSKRLEGDALVCLISSTQALVFCSICFSDDASRKPKDDLDSHHEISSKSKNRVRVIARPVESTEANISHILGKLRHLFSSPYDDEHTTLQAHSPRPTSRVRARWWNFRE
jgi:hypothetical protein